MARTLAQVKAKLRKLIGRGTALDDDLWDFVSKAVRAVERRKSLLYMQNLVETTLDPEAEYPRTLRLTDTLIKSISMFRIVGEAEYSYLTAYKDARNMPVPASKQPTGYLQVQSNLLFLDHTPDDEYACEVLWFSYTDLGTADTTEHWLFDNFSDGLEHFAMYYACRHTRDYERSDKELILGIRTLDDLIVADEDASFENAEIAMHPYVP